MEKTTNGPASGEPDPGRMGAVLTALRRNFWGIVTIVGVTAACFLIVQTFKKPGQMSVIESQAMDMSALQPPEGALPVAIAPVRHEDISGSVTYTGTVQAFEDEDVYPRITGRIIAMPVYPGDRVRKGQLLLQLDPSEQSEYRARLEEARSAEDAAMHNSGIAKSEFLQKQHELSAAQKAEEAARSAVEEVEASVAYWRPELERQSSLYKAQVVSLDEYQKEAAELKAAEAKLLQAKARLEEAVSLRQAAQSALDTMVHHVGHQYAAARQAAAATKNAAIIDRYTRVLAQDDGVVTRRLISPGVVVNPGMLVLKIAHINSVRVQAEVAGEDAGRIKLGNEVYIKDAASDEEALKARVSAIFPAADPASRTVTVEALIANIPPGEPATGKKQVQSTGSYRYLPGQYVIMRIATGSSRGLTVPTSAVVFREGQAHVWKVTAGGGTGTPSYQCPMHPEVVSDRKGKCPKCGMDLVLRTKGGHKVADLVKVAVGLANADRTQIVKGLAEGDEVVYAGYASLQSGTPVVAAEWGEAGPVRLPLASEVQGNRLDASNNWTHQEMVDSLMLDVRLAPGKGGSNAIVVKLEKHSGGAVAGAQVRAKTSMPGMNMLGPDVTATTGPAGGATLTTNFMSGLWRVELSIKAPGAAAFERSLDVEVP